MPGVTRFKQDPYVKCDYYCKETAIEIKCKGICGRHTVNVFESGQDKKDYKDDFCNGLYWNCPLHIAIEQDTFIE